MGKVSIPRPVIMKIVLLAALVTVSAILCSSIVKMDEKDGRAHSCKDGRAHSSNFLLPAIKSSVK